MYPSLKKWLWKKWFWPAAVMLGALPALVFAQFVPFNIDALRGVPSRILVAEGERQIHHSRHAYSPVLVEARNREEEENRLRVRNRRRLEQLASQIRSNRILEAKSSPGKNGKAQSVQVARTVVDVPYQNLILRFVNPKQAPVVGVPLVATIHPKSGADIVLNNLVTDSQGHVKLAKIGPLPVSVDFALASASGAESGEPEWRLLDPRSASLVIPSGMGPKVAVYAGQPYQVAGLRPSAENRRAIIYEYQQPGPVVVERTVADLDIAAPAGSSVTTPALGDQTLTVPATGHLVCRLPLSALQSGPVPIRVAASLPAGEAEAVLTEYATDPYQENTAAAPDLQLVKVRNIALTGAVGVLARREDVVQSFGDLQRKGTIGTIAALGDGSQVWNYPQQGIAFKLRPSPFKTGSGSGAIVERIRLSSVSGGSVGGITVGSSAAEVSQAFGKSESEVPSGSEPGTTENYLDQGIRIGEAAGKVQWIEIARPTDLLTQGTTAFVPRGAANLYVENYQGDAHTSIGSVSDLKAYLSKLPSVHLVASKEDADLALQARVTDFEGHRDQIVSGFPFKYSCSVKLSYSLYDPETSLYTVRNKEVAASSKADYTTETALGVVGTAVLLTRKNIYAQIAGTLLGVGGIIELQKSMQRAANRCPGIASRTVFDAMVQDINRASDFSVRMTGIDYGRGLLTFNVGTAKGIHVSTPEEPCEFEVLISGQPLPSQEGGNSADYYTAVVVGAQENSCTCELHHVKRKVNRSSESVDDQRDSEMVRNIPEPATGVVSARASIRFPSLPVITDQDVQEAQAAAEQEQKSQENQPSPPQNNANDQNKANDALSSILGKIFGKPKK